MVLFGHVGFSKYIHIFALPTSRRYNIVAQRVVNIKNSTILISFLSMHITQSSLKNDVKHMGVKLTGKSNTHEFITFK